MQSSEVKWTRTYACSPTRKMQILSEQILAETMPSQGLRNLKPTARNPSLFSQIWTLHNPCEQQHVTTGTNPSAGSPELTSSIPCARCQIQTLVNQRFRSFVDSMSNRDGRSRAQRELRQVESIRIPTWWRPSGQMCGAKLKSRCARSPKETEMIQASSIHRRRELHPGGRKSAATWTHQSCRSPVATAMTPVLSGHKLTWRILSA